jgi:serine/threonine-protein kinase RsbW
MTDAITLTVPAKMTYLHLVSRFAARIARGIAPRGGPVDRSDFSHAFELALSESFTNAVKHGGASMTRRRIVIEFETGENSLHVTLKDPNPPFAIHDLTAPDIDAHPESGYGIFLLKQVMDTVSFRRENGCNELTMAKKAV